MPNNPVANFTAIAAGGIATTSILYVVNSPFTVGADRQITVANFAASATSDGLVNQLTQSFAGPKTFTTSIASPSITDSSLTATRLTFAGTGGLLSDSTVMTFASSTLSVNTGNVAITGLTTGQNLQITKGAGSTNAIRITLDGTGDAISFIGSSGDRNAYFNDAANLFMATSITVSGTTSGSGVGRSMTQVTNGAGAEPYMMGAWSDIIGPAVPIRLSNDVSLANRFLSCIDFTGNFLFDIGHTGGLSWGAGNYAALDTTLARTAAATLRLSNTLILGTANSAAGTLTLANSAANASTSLISGNVAADRTFKFPAADPSAGQALVGTLSGSTITLSYVTLTTGTVTSVSFTGGLISVANPTTTPALTVAGTSGGIPYFSSATTWASSALLASNGIVLGGGAATAPFTSTQITYIQNSGLAFVALGDQSTGDQATLRLQGETSQLDFYNKTVARWSLGNAGAATLGLRDVVNSVDLITFTAGATATIRMASFSSQVIVTDLVSAKSLTVTDGTNLITSTAAFANGAAAQVGTLTNAPAAGNPTKWIPISDNSVVRYIPCW
jgi:hypothetical protein